MKISISKILSVIICFTLTLTGVCLLNKYASAYTAEEGVIQVEGEKATYNLYRLMYGETVLTDATKLKNCSFDYDSLSQEFWDELANVYPDASGISIPEKMGDWLNKENDLDSDRFSAVLANIAQEKGVAVATITDNEPVNIPVGYYIAVSDVIHPVFLVITTADTTKIVSKHTTPVVDKNIILSKDNKVKEYDTKIGDNVDFEVETTLSSNLKAYDKYELQIVDAPSKFIEVDEDTIKVNLVSNAEEESDITASVSSAEYDKNDNKITIKIDDVLTQLTDVKATDIIRLTYTAKVTADANTGFNNPIYNNATVFYTSSPTTKDLADTTKQNTKDEVVDNNQGEPVELLKAKYNKTRNTSDDIQAGNTDDKENLGQTDNPSEEKSVSSSVSLYTFVLDIALFGGDTDLLDTIKLTKPEKSIVLKDSSFTLQDSKGRYWSSDNEWTNTKGVNTTHKLDQSGKFSFKGLNDDNYVLTQVTTQDGYQLAKEPIKFEIKTAYTDDKKTLDAKITDNYNATLSNINANTGVISIDVINAVNPPEILQQLGDNLVIVGIVGLVLLVLIILFIKRRRENN